MDRSGHDQTATEDREDSSDPLLRLLERMALPPEPTLAPGASLGRYRVVSLLDRGGMGEVYRAHDERLGRDVAIKVVRSGERASPALQRRFETEAKAVGGLSHPNVVAVFDAGEENGCPYLVTELLDGETLAQRVRRAALAPAAAVEAALGIARALEAAHAAGVVHRDLKPANVFVTADGRIKVLDFGLAKLLSDRPGAGFFSTESGAVLGTAGYMSPEQVRAQPADPRSDIFSFGAILYEMLSGSGAFKSASATETNYAILNGAPTPLPARVPAGLARIVECCLAKKPDDRFQSAHELIDALASTAVELPVGRVERTAPAQPVRARVALVLIGIGLLAAPGLLYYLLPHSSRPAPDSIAVVPFVNMSGDKENEYFSDGVTEELINALANVPGLRVASRTSVFALKGKGLDARQIGERLGVKTLLEGSVRREGNALRVTAQLIHVADDAHLWSQTYDRELKSIFAVEDEIARSIAQTLRRRLAGGESASLVKPSTSSQDAHDLYLRGQYFKERRTEESLRRAAAYFEQAIEKDPDYALAYVGLAYSAALQQVHDDAVPASAVLPKAKQAVAHALELDAGLAEAHATLGIIAGMDYDWAAAERAERRAIELMPEYADAHHWLAMTLGFTGRLREARTEAEQAVRLDPASLVRNSVVGLVALWDRDFPAAEAALKRTLEMDPTFVLAHSFLGGLYAAQRKYAEAETEIDNGRASWRQGHLGLVYALAGRGDDALRLIEQFELSPSARGFIWVALGEKERGYALLEKACAERRSGLRSIKVNPIYDFMRSDPEFESLLKCVNLE